jgi:hypothetical protein
VFTYEKYVQIPSSVVTRISQNEREYYDSNSDLCILYAISPSTELRSKYKFMSESVYFL